MSTALRIAHGAFGRVALLGMDRPLVRHAHPHCHVLLKVEGADTRFAVGDTTAPLTDGTAVLVNGWEPHAYVHDPERPQTLILALYIEPEWLDVFHRGWMASGGPGFFAHPCGEISPAIRTFAHDLATEMMARPNARTSHEALLSELMIAVIERFAEWRRADTAIAAVRSFPRMDWRIRRAVAAMQAGLADDLDATHLARQAGMSRAHFFRLFTASMNLPPRVYFNVLRLEAAVHDMIGQDDNVAAIGGRLGFTTPAHFTRFFRDHAGVPPTEFRAVARLAM